MDRYVVRANSGDIIANISTFPIALPEEHEICAGTSMIVLSRPVHDFGICTAVLESDPDGQKLRMFDGEYIIIKRSESLHSSEKEVQAKRERDYLCASAKDHRWFNNGITLKCPKCECNMKIYEGEKDIIYLQCVNEKCNCRVILEGDILDNYPA